MTAFGQIRQSRHVAVESALPLSPDFFCSIHFFREVPIPDSCTAANSISFDHLVSRYRPWPTGLEGRAVIKTILQVASNERLSGRTPDQSERCGWAASGGDFPDTRVDRARSRPR